MSIDITGQHGDASEVEYNRPVWPREYSPSPAIPKFFSSGLFHKFGQNPHGEANYIVTWGMDARQFSNGDPNAIKYPNPNDPELGWACFMLERWAPPTFFNEDEWNRLRFGELTTSGYVDHLGPFRSRGSYILVAPLATDKDGQPYDMLPLTEKVLQELYQRLGTGYLKPDERLAQLELQRRIRKSNAQKSLRAALDKNFEHYRQKADMINTLATRHTVAPSIDLPMKSTIDEARKRLVPKGVNHEHTAGTRA